MNLHAEPAAIDWTYEYRASDDFSAYYEYRDTEYYVNGGTEHLGFSFNISEHREHPAHRAHGFLIPFYRDEAETELVGYRFISYEYPEPTC